MNLFKIVTCETDITPCETHTIFYCPCSHCSKDPIKKPSEFVPKERLLATDNIANYLCSFKMHGSIEVNFESLMRKTIHSNTDVV